MTQYKRRNWKHVSQERSEELRKFLQSKGASIDVKTTPPESWRARLEGTVFTMYSTGTLSSTAALNDATLAVQDEISSIIGETTEKPEKEILIGLDETGKGEVLGHSVLTGAVIPSNLLEELHTILGVADTKKKRTVGYWDDLFLDIDALKKKGLSYITETIPPWHADKYNLNKIMDLVYQRIITHLMQGLEPTKCRIIIDDYGVGKNLSEYLQSLHKSGCDVRVESKADDHYDECRLASIISKRERTRLMESISKSYSMPGYPVGSGNAGDPETLPWLKEYWNQHHEWPWFVKKSYSTIMEIEGRKTKTKKIEPPIRHELLTNESHSLFHEGKLSITSLTLSCPKCGTNMRSCKVTPDENARLVGRCIQCDTIIEDLSTTLLYYCGFIVLDSNVIISKLVVEDLEKGKFFEGFTFLLHPAVHKECDTENGRKQLDLLARFSSMGRIKLQHIDTFGSSIDVDESIVESARKYNAILYTRDKRMYAIAASKNVFFLT